MKQKLAKKIKLNLFLVKSTAFCVLKEYKRNYFNFRQERKYFLDINK